MVMSLRSVLSTALRTKLLTVPEIVTKFTNDAGVFEYFLGIAPGDQDVLRRAYIKSNHIFGGERPRTPRREFDVLWQLAVVSTDQPEAEEWDAVIYDTLIKSPPNGVRLEYLDGWTADSDITFNGSMAEPDTSQGIQFWSVGGYYRLRGAK